MKIISYHTSRLLITFFVVLLCGLTGIVQAEEIYPQPPATVLEDSASKAETFKTQGVGFSKSVPGAFKFTLSGKLDLPPYDPNKPSKPSCTYKCDCGRRCKVNMRGEVTCWTECTNCRLVCK